MAFEREGPRAPAEDGLVETVEALYEEHYEGLYRYLLLCGCEPADAADHLQEGFLRLFVFLKKGNTLHKPKSWLLRVLHNLRVDLSRQEQRRAPAVEGFEDQFAKAYGTASDPETESLTKERHQRLLQAVRSLTPRQYEFLVLRASGLKLREIAELHGVSLQTVAEACARATHRLGRLTHE